MPLPGLGPNCPGGPERGEPSLCGQSQAAKQGDTEMPPCSLEEGVLEYLDGYTVWAEARTRPCPLPRRSASFCLKFPLPLLCLSPCIWA